MRFFKDNLDSIVKLYINQIGVAIFSIFIYTAAGSFTDDGKSSLLVKVLISVFAILFYFVLIYNVAWEIGAKDKIRIDGGRAEMKKSKGILLGLYANIPNFVVVGIAFILFAVYMMSGAEGLKSTFAVLNLIFRLFISMYLGLIQALTSGISENVDLSYLIQTLLYLVFSVIAALITHVSYLLGLKDFRILPASKPNRE
ncbi:MAG: hypothetical protein IJY23_02720 [Clostridia bacterium]|nr:hypothetical protein [Clostridia bacterium]